MIWNSIMRTQTRKNLTSASQNPSVGIHLRNQVQGAVQSRPSSSPWIQTLHSQFPESDAVWRHYGQILLEERFVTCTDPALTSFAGTGHLGSVPIRLGASGSPAASHIRRDRSKSASSCSWWWKATPAWGPDGLHISLQHQRQREHLRYHGLRLCRSLDRNASHAGC